MKFILLAASMSLAVLGQFFLKKGVLAAHLAPNLIAITRTVLSPQVLVGFFLYGISSVIWLFVLQKFPLSVAYPTLSLTYVVIIIFSFFAFQEPITIFKILGVASIIFGVFLLFR